MVMVVRRRNGLAFGTSKNVLAFKNGFTFIEIIIALLIISIFMTVAVPRFLTRGGTTVLNDTIEHINRLTRFAYVRALVTGRLHRVFFALSDNPEVRLEQQVGTSSSGKPLFEAIETAPVPTRYELDGRIVFKNFFIKRIDEAAAGLKEAWYFVFPAGLSQEVILNIVDEESRAQRGLILNPFSVKFTVYNEFQAP